MLKVMPESQGNFLYVEATGKLTDADYKTVLIPHVEAILADHEALRVLFVMDEHFEGWELGAMWDDTKFGTAHRNDFEKAAVVGGPKWMSWCISLSEHFMKGEAKAFPLGELEQAKAWLDA